MYNIPKLQGARSGAIQPFHDFPPSSPQLEKEASYLHQAASFISLVSTEFQGRPQIHHWKVGSMNAVCSP